MPSSPNLKDEVSSPMEAAIENKEIMKVDEISGRQDGAAGKQERDNEEEEENEQTSSDSSFSEDDEISNFSSEEMPLFKYARYSQTPLPLSSPPSPSSPLCTATVMGNGSCPPPSSVENKSGPASAGETDPKSYTRSQICMIVTAFGFQNGTVHLLDATTGLALGSPSEISTGTKSPIVAMSFDSTGRYLMAAQKNGDMAILELKYRYIRENNTMVKRVMQQLPVPTRFAYSSNTHSSPVCLALDPSYAKKREKAWAIGFADGRIILTRQGRFWGMRSDSTIYQGSGAAKSAISDRAIHCITWRGSLLAWADGSGVKLYDVEQNQRLAHIDRPSGANPGLFPYCLALKCHLVYETADKLLVAWGDCLMQISVRETLEKTSSGGDVVRRRRIECSMAWELDCVACGVVPMDENNIAVLGLSEGQVLELQVVRRDVGTVASADALLLEYPEGEEGRIPATAYGLVSSYALPKMEDVAECDEERVLVSATGVATPGMAMLTDALSGMAGGEQKKFQDSHLRWSLQNISFSVNDDDNVNEGEEKVESSSMLEKFFQSQKLQQQEESEKISKIPPPIMLISSPYDSVLVRTRDVDDVISHALINMHDSEKAICLALKFRRLLRRYELKDVVNRYLSDLLFRENLTLNQLRYAAEMTPVLLGGDGDLWEKWMCEFAKIKGGLFVLREFLPVRDPKLAPSIYEITLEKMLIEIETLPDEDNSSTSAETYYTSQKQGKQLYLDALRVWGQTSAIRERLDLYQHFSNGRREQPHLTSESDPSRKRARMDLYWRLHQSAAGFLQAKDCLQMKEDTFESISPIQHNHSDIADSLYHIDHFMLRLSCRLPPSFSSIVDFSKEQSLLSISLVMEALAELYYMKRQYEEALKVYFWIGTHFFSLQQIEILEKEAIDIVNGKQVVNIGDEKDNEYSHILPMMECHFLHSALLNTSLVPLSEFRSKGHHRETAISCPVVALIQLVGLVPAGQFLLQHSHPPTTSAQPMSSESPTSVSSSPHLPFDQIASQLSTRPKLLHWYLHQIFTYRPELYINFPNTHIPPKSVTDLHRAHLDLHIEYAEIPTEETIPLHESVNRPLSVANNTPLVNFLKEALPYGGIRAENTRRLLEKHSHERFACALAYVMEQQELSSSEEVQNSSHIDDAKTILRLYLENVRSLPLAVAYAERHLRYSNLLWEDLVLYCLQSSFNPGVLLGALLEAAAKSGADLVGIISKIPLGMEIEGLRPRLVDAVEDLKSRVQMHESAVGIMRRDKVKLLRELGQRSRRGVRVGWSKESRMRVMGSGLLLRRGGGGGGVAHGDATSSRITEENDSKPVGDNQKITTVEESKSISKSLTYADVARKAGNSNGKTSGEKVEKTWRS